MDPLIILTLVISLIALLVAIAVIWMPRGHLGPRRHRAEGQAPETAWAWLAPSIIAGGSDGHGGYDCGSHGGDGAGCDGGGSH